MDAVQWANPDTVKSNQARVVFRLRFLCLIMVVISVVVPWAIVSYETRPGETASYGIALWGVVQVNAQYYQSLWPWAFLGLFLPNAFPCYFASEYARVQLRKGKTVPANIFITAGGLAIPALAMNLSDIFQHLMNPQYQANFVYFPSTLVNGSIAVVMLTFIGLNRIGPWIVPPLSPGMVESLVPKRQKQVQFLKTIISLCEQNQGCTSISDIASATGFPAPIVKAKISNLVNGHVFVLRKSESRDTIKVARVNLPQF